MRSQEERPRSWLAGGCLWGASEVGHEADILVSTGPTTTLYRRIHEAAHYRLRTLAGGRWAHRCHPILIVLLLTERCNARCLHCDIWKNRGREDSPSPAEWQSVLADLRSWLGPVQVTFSGGEALLKPFTTELVAFGSRLGLAVEVLTHGYWVDQSRIEALALANPWRVTVSLDGIGETHSLVRGRPGFFDKTAASIETLRWIRRERRLRFAIRLKHVIMEHTLGQSVEVARFAKAHDCDVFYQPIEQNYNTADNPTWFEHSANWPREPERAVAVVRELLALRRAGYPIRNSRAQLEAMVPYFREPAAWRMATQTHSAHERRQLCAALTMLQIQANGDVTVCPGLPPVGNIRTTPVRRVWEARPAVWRGGCCLTRRASAAEQTRRPLGGE